MKRAYKYRLYPSKKQVEILNRVLGSCRYLYNAQLEYEKYVYEAQQRFAHKFELNNLLPDMKIIDSSLKHIHSQVLQNVNDRVIRSFHGFFSRIRKGMNPGYPRFKGKHRYSSFTYPRKGFSLTANNRLRLSKIGEIPIKLHREIIGKIKTLTITKTPTNKWFACFSVQQDVSPVKHSSNKIVGIDLGLDNFATLSDGSVINNPRWLKESLGKLQFLSRRLSKKKKGSSNRRKARFKLARLYEKVSNQRLDFLHKTSRKLVSEYSGIALEDLNPSEMDDKYLQFSINDVSWGSFRQLLAYKAEEAGCRLDFVDPKNTSKRCSGCGNVMDMPLSKRQYDCSVCGNSMPRDLNAAFNILKTSCFPSTVGQTGSNACGDASLEAPMNQEATNFS